jgi:3-hydroxybutyryl-CoA dehydratase
MVNLGFKVGETVTFSKTVGECDVYQFAGITGDFFPNHVNDQFMKATPYGQRIAHGLLTLAFSSTTSSILATRSLEHRADYVPVSLGYDRVRFIKPVFIGDTITVRYTIAEVDLERLRSKSKIEAVNQHGDTVMVAEHIMKWVRKELSHTVR